MSAGLVFPTIVNFTDCYSSGLSKPATDLTYSPAVDDKFNMSPLFLYSSIVWTRSSRSFDILVEFWTYSIKSSRLRRFENALKTECLLSHSRLNKTSQSSIRKEKGEVREMWQDRVLDWGFIWAYSLPSFCINWTSMRCILYSSIWESVCCLRKIA